MFKVGDKVTNASGFVFEIERVESPQVYFKGYSSVYNPDRFTLITPSPFKIGDKVRCIDTQGFSQISLHQEYKVWDISSNHSIQVYQKIGAAEEFWYPNGCFEVTSKFKVGDRVKCVDTDGFSYISLQVEYVVSNISNDSTIQVKPDVFWYPNKCFELITSKFKVGDKVKHKVSDVVYIIDDVVGEKIRAQGYQNLYWASSFELAPAILTQGTHEIETEKQHITINVSPYAQVTINM